MKTRLKCHCGQRILRRDVMQQGYYVKQLGPSYVYIKYRCSRCKKLGEHFVKQEEWEEGLLQDSQSEVRDEDRARFGQMGAITLEEVRRFHMTLEGLQRIPDPLGEERS